MTPVVPKSESDIADEIDKWLELTRQLEMSSYAEITLRMKEDALKLCEPPVEADGRGRKPAWHEDANLMSWLASL